MRNHLKVKRMKAAPMASQRKNARRSESGFSLVELMVAVVVMAIVTSQILLTFSQQQTSSLEHERTIEIQEEARMVMDILLRDIRLAGFMVPEFVAIASVDGGTAASDLLCVSSSDVIADTTLTAAGQKFAGADVSVAMPGSSSSVTVTTSSLDIDGNGSNDFAVGSGVIIGTGTEAHCGTITSIGASGGGMAIGFTPATRSTMSATSSDVVVPAIVYSVTGTTISRNSVVLSDYVEDIQTEFGVDGDRSGTVGDDGNVPSTEFPIDNLDGDEYELVRNVRVHLTAREARAEAGFNGRFYEVANRLQAGATDNFKRRRVTGDAILRNLR